MNDYRNKPDQRHEILYGKKKEEYWTCGKCMAVLVERVCMHCTRGQKEETEMSERMNELVKDYNTLTGRSIKRFSSIAEGEQRIMNFKTPPPKKTPAAPGPNARRAEGAKDSWDQDGVAERRSKRNSCTVDGTHYRTIVEAWTVLKLPPGMMIPFRAQLKKTTTATFTHHGASYRFVATPYQSEKEKPA